MNLNTLLAELRAEHKRLGNAIAVIEGLGGDRRPHSPKRKTMSAAARKRIAAAQRARWRKWKAAHK
jgi:hypothetical protein